MKCPSLYHFYRAYYGGAGQGKAHFARAIIEAGKQLERIFETHDWEGYHRYASQQYALSLTKGFLRKFYELAEQHYGEELFDELQWLNNRIILPKEALGKAEVYIPFSFCFAAKEKRFIFMEYGKLDDAEKWLPIFKTLVESFVVGASLPEAEMVTYWDLMKGTTIELSYPDSFLAPRERVLQTARRLAEQAKKGRR
ncbi:hypothetical protein [Paenibacillus thalictri]|uniref:Uncharacterized protein n=1 Tax=Paenibacillus thalictri TaxID=2527873 RepID=A0A4Q9DJ72_9BACL|nr:hypothetical protein [Paenibacillus thalictri]TBL70898.1 hypothetical protein EYB31_32170 [Paenibacillus thalictri]